MEIQIDAELSGGNVIVKSMREGVVTLAPDLRDTAGHWFYWAMRVRAGPGEVRFCFEGKDPGPFYSTLGPVFSTDHGRTWSWLKPDAPDYHSFSFTFRDPGETILLASVIPYSGRELNTFLQSEEATGMEIFTFCRSGRGSAVPGFRMGPKGGERVRQRIIVTARHHACETMGSFVLEGLLKAWEAVEDTELIAVPFLDYDGVLAGDQGKNRRPYDHNRDYGDHPIYPEVATMQGLLGRNIPFYAIDLHCPYIIGEDWNEHLYQVGQENPGMARQQEAFGQVLESVAGGLPYHSSGDLPFGKAWNIPSAYGNGVSFARYAANQPHARLATTLEIPYAMANGVEVTPQGARRFGRSLASSLRIFAGAEIDT